MTAGIYRKKETVAMTVLTHRFRLPHHLQDHPRYLRRTNFPRWWPARGAKSSGTCHRKGQRALMNILGKQRNTLAARPQIAKIEEK